MNKPLNLTTLVVLFFCSICCARNSIAQDSVTISDTPEAAFFSGKTMGPIRFKVVLAHNERQKFQEVEELSKVANTIEFELSEVNRLMSTYLPDSDVSRFNAFDKSDQWFDVDPATATVVDRALQISRKTDGAFDITIGPVVDLWGFGPNKEKQNVPSPDSIANLLEHVGHDKLKVRLDPPALSKTSAQVQIDLSAIAKGYAVDRIVSAMSEMGYQDFLVEVGGEVAVRGEKKKDDPWLVGIMQPIASVTSVRERIRVADQAVASSGDYQNFFVIGDKTYSHTIDPSTGMPVEHHLASCSIIADTCMDADAFATAVTVMGQKEGIDFCKREGLEYYLIVRNPGKPLSEFASPGFGIETKTSDDAGFSNFFIGALVIFGIAVAAMAVGVMFGRKRIQGSCGGIASLQSGSVSPECSVCSTPTEQCSELKKALDKQRANT